MIEEFAKKLYAARKATVDAEKAHYDSSAGWIAANDAIKEVLRQAGHSQLLDALDSAMNTMHNTDEALKAAKKVEKEAHEGLTTAAEKEALFMAAKGENPYGRGLHSNIEVVRSTEVQFPDNPYEFGSAMAELVLKGKRELISVKVHGNTDWFKSNTSALIKLREVPAIRVDSHDKWSE